MAKSVSISLDSIVSNKICDAADLALALGIASSMELFNDLLQSRRYELTAHRCRADSYLPQETVETPSHLDFDAELLTAGP